MMNRSSRTLAQPATPSQTPKRPGAAGGLVRAAQSRRETWAAVLVLVVAGVVFYCNTFASPFVFDDKVYIRQKPTLHTLWPPWTPMTSSHRPVVDFSFALDYALHGYTIWPYHAVNLAIHIAAALTLFGILRRTLSRGTPAQRYGGAAWGLALTTALLWLVHPLQTESVTYIYQRFESLMGLFFLLTFYCFLRAQDSPRARWWYAGSIASCLLAMGSKEVGVVLPLLLVWYDRAVLASSWKELLRNRWPYYAALGGLLALLAGLVVHSMSIYAGGGMLVVKNVTPLGYAATQPGVILHYLRLAVWPQGQCLDYGWPLAKTPMEIVPPLLVLLVLWGLTAWCVWRYPAWGFVGAWFFLILAPSSSFIPIRDLAFEHRMYLPLAAVLIALVIGTYELLQRLPAYRAGTASSRRWFQVVPVVVVAGALGVTTLSRNTVYASEKAIWHDIVEKSPGHARGFNNLGLYYMIEHDPVEAEKYLREAIRLKPDYYDAHYNLAQLFVQTRPEEAMQHYRVCLKSHEWFLPHAYHNLGLLLAKKGEVEEAREMLEAAAKLEPKNPKILGNLASVLTSRDPERAVRLCQKALELSPGDPEIVHKLSFALNQLGRRSEAVAYYEKALDVHPESPALHFQLAQILPESDPRAIQELLAALKLAPNFPQAYYELGSILEKRGRVRDAMVQYRRALELRPDYDEARSRLNAILQAHPELKELL